MTQNIDEFLKGTRHEAAVMKQLTTIHNIYVLSYVLVRRDSHVSYDGTCNSAVVFVCFLMELCMHIYIYI